MKPSVSLVAVLASMAITASGRATGDPPDGGVAVAGTAETRPNPLGAPFHAGWYHHSHLQGRLNPTGLSWFSETGYRWFLYDSDDLLLRSCHLDLGIDGRVTPASLSAGPYVELVPLAFLKLRATLRPLGYFGVLGSLFPLDGVGDDWSPDRMRQVVRDSAGDAALGLLLAVNATLQAKAGPVVALYENQLDTLWMDVDGAYFEPLSYFALEQKDAVWTMSTTAGVLFGPGPPDWFLVLGGRHDRLQTREHGFLRHLVGGVALWQIPGDWIAWGHPQLAVLVQAYVRDRYREGEVYGAFQLSFRF